MAHEKWLEVWADLTDPPYLLLVQPGPDGEGVVVMDIKEDFKVVYRGQTYEDVRWWLLEDEYEMVRGRTPVE